MRGILRTYKESDQASTTLSDPHTMSEQMERARLDGSCGGVGGLRCTVYLPCAKKAYYTHVCQHIDHFSSTDPSLEIYVCGGISGNPKRILALVSTNYLFDCIPRLRSPHLPIMTRIRQKTTCLRQK
eukprot:gene4355-8516_t